MYISNFKKKKSDTFLPGLISLLLEGFLWHHSICHLACTQYSFSEHISTTQSSYYADLEAADLVCPKWQMICYWLIFFLLNISTPTT